MALSTLAFRFALQRRGGSLTRLSFMMLPFPYPEEGSGGAGGGAGQKENEEKESEYLRLDFRERISSNKAVCMDESTDDGASLGVFNCELGDQISRDPSGEKGWTKFQRV